MKPSDWLALLEETADRTDPIARRFFGDASLRVDSKDDLSPVTEADRAIEAAARRLLSRRHPELGVLGEEEGETGPAGRRLIIDPIDATRNFVRGIPIFATLLAVEEEGEVVAGLVSAPALGTRWRAARGAGAFLGTRRLRVSPVTRLEEAQLFHGDLVGARETPPPGRLAGLAGRVGRARGFGDFYQHVLVAQGSGEAAIDPSLSPWDAAPLLLLVEEAGGRATTLAGERTIYGGSLLSTNGLLHDELLERLERLGATPSAATSPRPSRRAGGHPTEA